MINFVFLNNELTPNGDGKFARQGPFNDYIKKHNFSYTLDGTLKDGFKNLLPIEIDKGGYGVRDIPIGLIQFINENDIKLLILGLPDPTGKDAYRFSLEHLNKLGLDFNKLIYIDTNIRLKDIDTGFKHKIYTFNFFIEEAIHNTEHFYDNENELGYISKQIELSEINTFRNKKFLCFNRSLNKAHRFILLDEFLKGTFTDSYFSFLRPIDYPVENEEFFSSYTETIVTSDQIYNYNKHIPIELDTQNVENKTSFAVSNTLKKELFLDSCINIATETTFATNELFLSEKILKPILGYQPFIVFGPHGYLVELKKYGFKTFSDFWDESYDDIQDPVERAKKLISLVKHLNNKTIEELNDIYRSTKDICIYNRNLFYSLKNDTLKVIFEEIKNEW
jgi:hypothetical protein